MKSELFEVAEAPGDCPKDNFWSNEKDTCFPEKKVETFLQSWCPIWVHSMYGNSQMPPVPREHYRSKISIAWTEFQSHFFKYVWRKKVNEEETVTERWTRRVVKDRLENAKCVNDGWLIMMKKVSVHCPREPQRCKEWVQRLSNKTQYIQALLSNHCHVTRITKTREKEAVLKPFVTAARCQVCMCKKTVHEASASNATSASDPLKKETKKGSDLDDRCPNAASAAHLSFRNRRIWRIRTFPCLWFRRFRICSVAACVVTICMVDQH